LALSGHRAGQHLHGWDERRQAIAQAADKAARTRDLLARRGIDCPDITGAGTGSFEFEAASSVYTELQCGSYIFMDADYRRNRDRDGAPDEGLRAEPLRLGDGDEPPGHCAPTVNLYDWYVCIRSNRVEQLWPITARGAVW